MKTDKFDDAIRRKLESIEPPFRERDWSHMQSFMHHYGYPPTWAGASQWLVPMAAAAAVTGLIVSTIWQFRTNQELSQSVQMLNKTVTRLETTQANLIKQQNRTDTVYVTNFTKAPALANPGQLSMGQPVQDELSMGDKNQYGFQPHSTGDQPQPGTDGASATGLAKFRPVPASPVITNQLAQRAESDQRSTNAATDPVAYPNILTDRPAASTPTKLTNAVQPDRTISPPNSTPDPGSSVARTERLSERRASGTSATTSPSAADQPEYNPKSGSTPSYAVATPAAGRDGGQRIELGTLPPANQAATRQTEVITLLSTRPMVFDSAYYVESMARRTRRIRSLMPAMVSALPATTKSTDVASSRPGWSGIRVRLGIAGDVGTAQWAKGIYSELLIGRHWSVGVGLNRINIRGDRFGNEDQFRQMTHNDFRQTYAPRIDPYLDIVDIDRQFTLWQIPVNISYRALLGEGFAFVPSVGMDVSVSAQENTTFTYRRGPYERNVTGLAPSRSCDLFNTYTVALGAEKSWKHIVLQAGPVLSMPTKSLADPVNPLSLGLRARVLFQF